MNIKLINKFLYYNKYKLRCAIGKRGITYNKIEGDQKTPKGTFIFKYILYRKDRLRFLKSQLKKKIIKKNMGWCDDPSSKLYNKLIRFPFKKNAERLWLSKKIYDVILIIDYNLNPVIKNKGSAIFFHLAKKNYLPTKGCIAVAKKDMLFLINKINNKTKLVIY
jgi:L,D-peptidoglycan transpeptidase YkuD (ErfK/YbiS/YcfS/YnhG family)